VLLAVDQELSEGPALWVAPELSDPVGSLEVGEAQNMQEFGSGGRPKGRPGAPGGGAQADRGARGRTLAPAAGGSLVPDLLWREPANGYVSGSGSGGRSNRWVSWSRCRPYVRCKRWISWSRYRSTQSRTLLALFAS